MGEISAVYDFLIRAAGSVFVFLNTYWIFSILLYMVIAGVFLRVILSIIRSK